MRRTEILIVGGGVIGSSIAYHLARQGRRVLVVERAAVAVKPSASWASAGGIRRQGRHAAEAALAGESMARWPHLEDELCAPLGYRQGGNLLVAETAPQAERLAAFVGRQHALGFADVRLLDRRELRELAPTLAGHLIAGSYSAADGQADPVKTTRAFAASAERCGATYWTATETTSLLASASRVRGARTARGDIEAETVVLAAGPWSDTLAAGIGIRLPIRTAVYQMLRSTPGRAATLRPVVSCLGRHLSLKQLGDGSFLLGGGWPADAAANRLGYALRDESISGNWVEGCAVLPALRELRVAEAWGGFEAESIDDLPFIGPTAAFSGLVLAVGFSGHGFAIAPAVGRTVAEIIAGRTAPELAALSPSRLDRLDPAAVEAFIAA